jgi:hypothetical protein
MKLVIEHATTKREINGAFNLCASRADVTELVAQLENRLNDKGWAYGW